MTLINFQILSQKNCDCISNSSRQIIVIKRFLMIKIPKSLEPLSINLEGRIPDIQSTAGTKRITKIKKMTTEKQEKQEEK